MGRKTGEEMIALLHTKSGQWDRVKYYVFDLPELPSLYEERMEALRKLTLPPEIQVIKSSQCQSNEHLSQLLQELTSQGAEGLIARKPLSTYFHGRASSMLKVKVSNCFLKISYGKIQKYKCCKHTLKEEDLYVNSIFTSIISRPNGMEVVVRCPAQIFLFPPEQGAVLTVKHTGYWKTGKLKYPYFWRERRDVTWDQIVSEAQNLANKHSSN